ncbi:MAG: tetratricopeptide repeat protein [Desulforhopalus sp.]
MIMMIKRMVILLLLFCTVLTVGCSSPEADKQQYYQKALDYIEQDNREAAILELRSAIQLDAKFGAARYQLGLLYLEEGDPKKAFAELLRAADLAPDNLDANYRTAQFYLLSRKRDESRKRIDHILSRDPAYQDALTLLADLELMEGRFGEAMAAVEKIGPDVESSDKLLNLRGRIYAAQQQWDGAEEAFQKAIVVNPTKFINYKTLLSLYETKKETDKARKLLDEMVEKFPDNPAAHLLLAGYYRSVGKVERVEEQLKKVVELAPDTPRFRLQLAEFYRQSDQMDSAEAVLVQARADIAKNPDIGSSLATLYFDRGKVEEARTLLDELQVESPGHGGVTLLHARFLQRDGKVRDSLPVVQGLSKDFPAWADPYFYLGLAHYSLGEVELAQHAVAEAIQRYGGDSKYHTLMAQLFEVQGEFEDAKKEAVVALRLNSKNIRAAIILSRAYIGAKEYRKAVALLDSLRKQVPGNTEILGNLALAFFGADDLQGGEEVLVELLELDPGNAQAIALYIGLRYKDDLGGAESFVREQIAQAPADQRLYLILGSLLERQKKEQESLAAYEKAKELDPQNTQPYLSAARLLTKLGKTDEAKAKYRAMIEQQPDSMPGHMGIAALLQAEGKTSEAMEQYRKVLEIKENYAPAANNLAWLIASDPEGDLGQALLLVMIAKQASPDDPLVADTLGWVFYQRNSFSLAIAQFELALQRRPDNPLIAYHLALAQSGNGQKEKAEKTLQALLARKVDFPERERAEELLAEIGRGTGA